MDDLKLGQVVRSTAGRDKGKFMIVCRFLDGENVALCDGDLRKIANPKKKKCKHIAKTNHVDEALMEKLVKGDKISNADLRKALEVFNGVCEGSFKEV